jgi:enoyl-CoA hydratase/carnithine racemase
MTQATPIQEPPVLFRPCGNIGLVLLNDASRRNALSASIIEGVVAALEASKESGMRAIVLGSAQTVFCAGADIREMLDSGWLAADGPASAAKTPLDLFEALESDDRPIIAAIDGLALGGGVELALACDLAIASQTAMFSLPEIGLGVVPNTAMARLPALIGPRAALELIWTRRRLTAAQAHEIGLVSRIVDSSQLIEQAIEMARSIVLNAPPGAIAAVKHGIGKGPAWADIRAILHTLRKEEWQEGFAAFLEKRKPDYESFWRKT